MTKQENDRFIIDYFDKNLRKGYKLEDLRMTLIKQGYLKMDVDRAFMQIKEKMKKDDADRERRAQELEDSKRQQVVEVVEEPKRSFFGKFFGK